MEHFDWLWAAFDWFWTAFERKAATSIKNEAARYLVGSLGVYLFVWVIFERQLRARKIRASTPGRQQILRELIYSASTILVFLVMSILVFKGAAGGMFKFYSDIETYGWAYLGLSVGVLILFHDTYFYWTHRIMHHPKLFRWFHVVHHRSHNPTPFTAYAFNPTEAAVNFSVAPAFALLLPIHDVTLIIYLWIMIARNTIAHCGYELLPNHWARHPILGLLTSVTHHDMHHENMTGNYGFYFTFWDRVMGTEHADYLDSVDRVTGVGRVAAA